MLQVVQILSPTTCSFITPQWTDANIEQANRPRVCFQFDRNSGAPGQAKTDTIDLAVKIDSIWRASELDNDARLEQFARRLHFGNIIIPKGCECLEEAGGVVAGAIVKEINITGETRVSVKDNGLAADHEATDLESPQELNELDDVGRKAGCAYDLRCHARTSG